MDKWDDSRINEKKDILAYELTALVHGKDEADKAQATSRSLFSGAGDDENMPTTTLAADMLKDGGIGILDLMVACGLTASKGEARRLVQQGGVTLDGEKVTDIALTVSAEQLTAGVKIRKGKKVFHKAVLA